MIEIKKEYFSSNKMMFIIFCVISIIALIVSILFDNTSANSMTNNRVFFIPVYVFILIGIMYKDLYDKKINKKLLSVQRKLKGAFVISKHKCLKYKHVHIRC